MDGEIGTLYQEGKQVGGVFDWAISGRLASWAKDNWVEAKATKLVTAQSYWLIEKPDDDIFEVELYQRIRNQLVLIDTGTIKLKLPEVNVLNRTLPAPLTLRWIDD